MALNCKHKYNGMDHLEKDIDKYFLNSHLKSPVDLYHYTNRNNANKIYETNIMWASAYNCMNDDKEFTTGMQIAKIEIINLINEINIESTLKDNFILYFENLLNKEINNPQLRPK